MTRLPALLILSLAIGYLGSPGGAQTLERGWSGEPAAPDRLPSDRDDADVETPFVDLGDFGLVTGRDDRR